MSLPFFAPFGDASSVHLQLGLNVCVSSERVENEACTVYFSWSSCCCWFALPVCLSALPAYGLCRSSFLSFMRALPPFALGGLIFTRSLFSCLIFVLALNLDHHHACQARRGTPPQHIRGYCCCALTYRHTFCVCTAFVNVVAVVILTHRHTLCACTAVFLLGSHLPGLLSSLLPKGSALYLLWACPVSRSFVDQSSCCVF